MLQYSEYGNKEALKHSTSTHKYNIELCKLIFEYEFEADRFEKSIDPLSYKEDLVEDSFPLRLILMRKQQFEDKSLVYKFGTDR